VRKTLQNEFEEHVGEKANLLPELLAETLENPTVAQQLQLPLTSNGF
jgi:hypothetical protein